MTDLNNNPEFTKLSKELPAVAISTVEEIINENGENTHITVTDTTQVPPKVFHLLGHKLLED